MNDEAVIRDVKERMDVIHGGHLALHAAVLALVATHPNPVAFRHAFAACAESMRAHALGLPHGDELCQTLEFVVEQIESIPMAAQSAHDG